MANILSFEDFILSLMLILLLKESKYQGKADISLPQPQRYRSHSWKADRWSDCYTITGCGLGERRRNVWCADKSGRKSPHVNCKQETKLSEIKRCYRPCRWKTGKWGRCITTNSNSPCKELSGIKKRTVSCVQRTKPNVNRHIDDEMCLRLHPKPSTEKPCGVTCPQDCIVSEFGRWSECDPCGVRNRTRTRKVLVAPSKGGRACPPLSEYQSCPHTTDCLRHTSPVYDFSVKLAKWSPCISPSSRAKGIPRKPIIGYRRRNVSCVNGLGETVHISWCTTRSALPTPTIESCIVSRSCRLTEWSQWYLMTEGCITSNGELYPEMRARYRKVSVLSEGDGSPCPPTVEKRVVTDKLPSCNSRYKWIHSNWGDCIPYEGKCGGGLQSRNVICLRVKDQVPVKDSFCKDTIPHRIQQCHIVCQRECLVSPWTEWGPCLPFNKLAPDRNSVGYQQRERQLIQAPTGDEDICPALVEVNTCQHPQVVKWMTGNWSSCLLRDMTQPCGEGVQNRDAVCITQSGIRASAALCNIHSSPPKLIAPCYVPCPRDCVLSDWSEWSSCTVTCASPSGGGVKSRRRRVLAEHGPGGKPCPALDTLIETDVCGYDSCSGYRWEKTVWSPCRPTKENESCGKGTQEREVKCVHDNGVVVSDKKCAPIPKPPSERPCHIECPRDCITTNFTDWTECPGNCKTGGVQQRTRYVLQSSTKGGVLCPEPMQETRICSHRDDIACLKKLNNTQTGGSYRWDATPWSECFLAPGEQCGFGYQIRKVSCVKDNGKEVRPHYCLLPESSDPPESNRRCRVFCKKTCMTSEWSSWFVAEEAGCSVNMTRTKESAGNMCEQEVLQQTMEFVQPPTLPNTEGDWSKCIINANNEQVVLINGKAVSGICGAGERYIKGNQFDSCRQMGVVKDMCLLECPQSCQMGEWSEWSLCNVTCGQGYRQRQRQVLKFGNKYGRRCPSATGSAELQEKVCDAPCEQYRWTTGEWSDCEIGSPMTVNCGNGLQRRTVSCSKLLGNHLMRNMDESFCDPFDRPDTKRSCFIPCPDDCVVSEWSAWSKCKEPCNSLQYRYRNKTVLRMSLPSAGARCPTLAEKEPCRYGSNCFHHKWLLGDWSSCILPQGAICGRGISTRAAACVRSNGRYVIPEYCGKLPVVPLTTTCDVDCPIDCETSEWSEWNDEECEPCNEKGRRHRTRHIIQNPSRTGQPCPVDLVQRIPCHYIPCYHWNVGKWSKCNLQGAGCGHGFRTRKVKCLRSDGVEVDGRNCLRMNVTEDTEGWLDAKWLERVHGAKEMEPCHVPCPGDCISSDWSEWSFCHRDCESGHVVGYQTRSRALLTYNESPDSSCPSTLWETKPCWGGPCFSYNWKVKGGSSQCVRSDGVIVYGGCDWASRPCYPPCTAKESLCDRETGKCICPEGLSPIFNISGVQEENIHHITSCIFLNSTDYSHIINQTTSSEEIILRYFPDLSVQVDLAFWTNKLSETKRCLPEWLERFKLYVAVFPNLCGSTCAWRVVNHTSGVTMTLKLVHSSSDWFSYSPQKDDNEISFWMYAMICAGSAFAIFVLVTVYLMCSQKAAAANQTGNRNLRMKSSVAR